MLPRAEPTSHQKSYSGNPLLLNVTDRILATINPTRSVA